MQPSSPAYRFNMRGSWRPMGTARPASSRAPLSAFGCIRRLPGHGSGLGTRVKGAFYRQGKRLHSTARRVKHTVALPKSHGKSQEKAPVEDEQAQAPQALEVESAQEAHLAEIGYAPHPAAR